MPIGIIVELLTGIAALILGEAAMSKFVRDWIRKILDKKKEPTKSYSDKLSELTRSLNRSTQEVDKILIEMSNVAKERGETVSTLEEDLLNLERREQETKKRIQDLENVPLAAVEHFAQLTSAGEKRSARRDYLLFAAGVLVSTIIAIVLKIFGWG